MPGGVALGRGGPGTFVFEGQWGLCIGANRTGGNSESSLGAYTQVSCALGPSAEQRLHKKGTIFYVRTLYCSTHCENTNVGIFFIDSGIDGGTEKEVSKLGLLVLTPSSPSYKFCDSG